MSKDVVYLAEERLCDFCRKQALYDGKTKLGPWAYMCEEHFRQFGVDLGTGRGQRLHYEERREHG